MDVFDGDKTSRLHLLGPQAVMRRDDELRVWEMRLQELAELVAMPGIHGHHNIIQQRERELLPEEPLHEREVKTDAHAVLMAFAVVGAGRKQAALIEIDIEIELPSLGVSFAVKLDSSSSLIAR